MVKILTTEKLVDLLLFRDVSRGHNHQVTNPQTLMPGSLGPVGFAHVALT